MKWWNTRLVIMFLACAAALYGQFGVVFPKDSLKLGMCVAAYFLLSGIVSLIDYFVIKGSSLAVCDKSGDVFVGIAMPKGESHATLKFRRGSEKSDVKVEIDKLFDEEGVLLQNATLNVFETSLTSFLKKDKKKD